MSAFPAEQVNKTMRNESDSTTNGTSSESEDDSNETNNQSEIETPLRLGTITQLIFPFDGKMANYGTFTSQFDHLVDKVKEIKLELKQVILVKLLPSSLAEELCPAEFSEQEYFSLRIRLDQQYSPQAQQVASMDELKKSPQQRL